MPLVLHPPTGHWAGNARCQLLPHRAIRDLREAAATADEALQASAMGKKINACMIHGGAMVVICWDDADVAVIHGVLPHGSFKRVVDPDIKYHVWFTDELGRYTIHDTLKIPGEPPGNICDLREYLERAQEIDIVIAKTIVFVPFACVFESERVPVWCMSELAPRGYDELQRMSREE